MKRIGNRKDVRGLRLRYLVTYRRILTGSQLLTDFWLALAMCRLFHRAKWILYMEKVVAGMIPIKAFMDTYGLTKAQVRFCLKQYGWE